MKIEDIISLSVILCVALPWISWIITLQSVYLRWGITMLIVQLCIVIAHKHFKWASQRPLDARNCGVCNDGGDYSKKGGMPSGHVTTATTFVTFAYLVTQSNTVLVLGMIYIYGMMWVRIKNKCHYPHQVIGGIVAGIILVHICWWLLEAFGL
jgi:membrane-associated phospholipid phosphatase